VQVTGLAVAGQQLAVHFGEDLSGMPVQPVERGGVENLAGGIA
jgi:hypothetical protein